MKKIGKVFLSAILTIAMVFGLVPVMSGETEAATKTFLSYSDFPINAFGDGKAFTANVSLATGSNITSLQGWTAVYGYNTNSYYWQYTYGNKTYKGNLTKVTRNDVKNVYPGYTSYTGYQLNTNSKPNFASIPEGTTVTLKIYASASYPGVGTKEFLVGSYNVSIVNRTVMIAEQELANWANLNQKQKNQKINSYFINGCGVNWEAPTAWCAAFSSYCVKTAGKGSLIRQGHYNCAEMRKNLITDGRYLSNYSNSAQVILNKVKPGDLVFFVGSTTRSDGSKGPQAKAKDSYGETYVTHHVGIVTNVTWSNNTVKITFIDGNANNGNIRKSSQYVNVKDGSTGAILGFGILH